jgi:uncharacterized DUF497 family protein
LTLYVQLAYTQRVLEFEWDNANRNHIAQHGVTSEQCELVMRHPVVTQPGRDATELRWKTTGFADGRRLEVVWTLRGERIRVVTAYWKGRKHK